MPKTRTTLTLSDRCRVQLEELAGGEERAWTRIIERAVEELHQRAQCTVAVEREQLDQVDEWAHMRGVGRDDAMRELLERGLRRTVDEMAGDLGRQLTRDRSRATAGRRRAR